MSKIESSAVWRRAMDLAVEVYGVSKRFPQEEKFGLTSQVRRAAASIPANIAEGYGRKGPREFEQHLGIARGSLLEVRTFLLLGVELGYVKTPTRALDLTVECAKLIAASRRTLRARD
jgi:four helix bundle protein